MSLFNAESLSIFKIKEFRLFVFARFFLTLAIQMQMSVISLQIYYEHTKSELALGMIGLTEAIPFICTSFFSGHFADIINRRKILIAGIFALFIGSVLLFSYSSPVIHLFRSLGMYALFGVVFLFGIIRSFLAATTHPFMSQLVPRNQYTNSATWNSTAWHIGAIMGPLLAGIIYGYHNGLNGDVCYAINSVLFLFSLFFIIRIGAKPMPQKEAKESIFDSMKVGLNFVFSNKMILSALSLDLFAVLFGGAVALIPAFTDKILHLGPEAYGLLRTAPAIGAVIMAFFLAVRPPARNAGKSLLWSVIAFGVFTILFALCTNYWLAFVMLVLTGAFDNISVVVRHSILQLMTPDSMRGRVSAINSIFIGSSNEIGAFESGLAARIMGLVPSIIFGGGMTILVVLGINKKNPELKKLDLTKIQ
jgi:MFS family permease